MIDADDIYCFSRERNDSSKRIMSVTGIMRRAGLVRFHVPMRIIRAAAEIGKQIHLVCHDIAEGGLDDYWSSDPKIAAYASAFEAWMKEWKFKFIFGERKVDHRRMGYTGRLDLYGTIHTGTRSAKPALIELKKGMRCGWHVLQTSAYERALQEEGHLVGERICLYLNGTVRGYAAKRHPERNLDWNRLTAALAIARLREEWLLVSQNDEYEFDQLLRGRLEEEEDCAAPL